MSTTTEINPELNELDSGMMIRRAVFLLVLIVLTFYYLKSDFRGLSAPLGMEQAQIAREIARGENFRTKCLRPVALAQINEKLQAEGDSSKTVSLMKVPDTFHSPLNPMLNAMILSIKPDILTVDPTSTIYTPDILIAGVAMVLMLASIGITYLLISRIFDTRIGGVTAFLMLLCEMLWRYSQSGLPQMLMLFLFSFATYFLYKAVENQQQGKPIYVWMAMAGGFFALLAMSHWLTMWMFMGLLVFASFYFTPKGIQTVVLFVIFGAITAIWARHNYVNSGDILGAGRYAFYSGMSDGSDNSLYRDFEQKSGMLNFDGMLTKMATNFIGQFSSLYGYLGSIVAAPLFFLSLLHPFRRKEIADFRWCLLSMWFFATIGMCLFGIKPHSEEPLGANNLHVLFVPLFTGYGLAFLSVLWNRLNLPVHQPIVRNGHFLIVIFLSSLPFLLNMILGIRQSTNRPKEANCHWPYYVPQALASLNASLNAQEVLVTDIPWATAWYADRVSIWLPKNKKQLNKLIQYGQDKNEEVVGMLFSPTSLNSKYMTHMMGGDYADWQDVIERLPISQLTSGQADTMIHDQEFPFKQPAWIGFGTIFYTDVQHINSFVDDYQKARKE